MTVGIIAAMDVELGVLIKRAQVQGKKTIAGVVFYAGTLDDKPVVLAQSGIGKVNMAVCATIMCEHFKVKKLLNIGIAGSLSTDVFRGDLVVATSLVQHDFDCTDFGYALMQVPGQDTYLKTDSDMTDSLYSDLCQSWSFGKVLKGTIASGDEFIWQPDLRLSIGAKTGALACEMEGAALAQVAHNFKTPFAVVRSISDDASSKDASDEHDFDEQQAINLANLLNF